MRANVFDEPHYASPMFELLRGRPYNRITIQTSRGCPLNCEFCAASLRLTSSYQQKPVAKAVEEIKQAMAVTQQPFFEFADDNTFVNKQWSKEFLRAITPLGLKWFTETDISIADDPDLLDLMADSGCRQILIGLESPRAEELTGVNPNDWKKRRAENYLQSIDKIQSKGASVNGCFVLGMDNQGPEIFEEIRDFVTQSQLLEVQVTVSTPFPGTPLYTRLKEAGRLLQDEYWDRCTLFDVNFKPKRMTVQELESGMQWLFSELYNEREYIKRKRHYMEIVRDTLIS
jgi:radical SAM superfamily enzyme YgiQ (UPF0313 family)